MKHTLHTAPIDGGPFNCQPAREITLDDDKIQAGWAHDLADFVTPHGPHLWVVGNEFGALRAVWADNEQDALDEMVDMGWGDGFLIPEEDADGDSARLGNAGEPADLTYCWMGRVIFDPARDVELMLALAYAAGAGTETLFF